MIKMKLHVKLAEHRMTQKQLSELTGIRVATISAYCNDANKHIVKEHLDKFCKLFNCPLTEIIEYKDSI